MRLLLGSGGFVTEALRKPWLAEIRDFLGPIRRVLFIPHALEDKDDYLKNIRNRWRELGLRIDGLHHARDPRRAARDAEAVMMGGGNTWRLLRSLRNLGLMSVLKNRAQRGMPYIGASAGSNVACPTIQTTNDMPILHPGTFQALNLVPFQINPHYFDGPFFYKRNGKMTAYGGETRDDRINEFHEENIRPVLGLYEGAWIRREGRRLTLGGGPARLFEKGKKAKSLRSGADLSPLLR